MFTETLEATCFALLKSTAVVPLGFKPASPASSLQLYCRLTSALSLHYKIMIYYFYVENVFF